MAYFTGWLCIANTLHRNSRPAKYRYRLNPWTKNYVLLIERRVPVPKAGFSHTFMEQAIDFCL